jgi:hypothetical protein
MDSSKLLIVGGVVLGGFYLLNKNKKDKENAQILVLQNTQPQSAILSQLEVESKPNGKAIVTSKEATVYATKTIAEVNSLMVKYPPLTMNQFIDNYNKVYNTNLTVGGDAILGFKFYAPKTEMNSVVQNANASSGARFNWGALVSAIQPNQPIQTNNPYGIVEIQQSEIRVSDANRQFEATKMAYTRWKSDFATVYSDLKNYFSTLTKEQADITVKYLPKLIIQALMGDNDPRARANDFYSQEEIIDMIDNSGIKDSEMLLTSALGNFFRNYKMSIGEYSGIKTAMPTTKITGTGLEMSNILAEKERELMWNAKMNEIALSERPF